MAAQVFDRVRYRVVTERRDQIAPVVWWLASHLFPFNYAVPGQAQNNLVRFSDILLAHPHGARLASELQLPPDLGSGIRPGRATSSAGRTSGC